jgi:hypothetical protein
VLLPFVLIFLCPHHINTFLVDATYCKRCGEYDMPLIITWAISEDIMLAGWGEERK